METPPQLDLKTEIDLIFAVGKNAQQIRDIVADRPWMQGSFGITEGAALPDERIQAFIATSIKTLAEKALAELEPPNADA